MERTTDQSIADSTVTPIVFDTTQYASGGMTLNGGSDGLVVPAGGAGRYIISANMLWEPLSGGFRAAIITVNDNFESDSQIPSVASNVNTELSLTTLITLAAGDVIKLKANQNRGGNTIVQGSAGGTRVWLAANRLAVAI